MLDQHKKISIFFGIFIFVVMTFLNPEGAWPLNLSGAESFGYHLGHYAPAIIGGLLYYKFNKKKT